MTVEHYNVVVETLPMDEPYALAKPITIHVREDIENEDIVASYHDAHVYIAGDNAREAIDNVIEVMIDYYEDLLDLDTRNELGVTPLRDLSVLKQVLITRSDCAPSSVVGDADKDKPTNDSDCPIDCGDNSCLCASKRGGMRTNGGCQCFEASHDYAENRAMAQRARLAVTYWRRRALEREGSR